jgi:copper chaperone
VSSIRRARAEDNAVDSSVVTFESALIDARFDRDRDMRAREISLDVDMMCEGCARAVRRICARIDGVKSVDVDVGSKTVVIVGDGLDPDDVRARVAKCGRETRVVRVSE